MNNPVNYSDPAGLWVAYGEKRLFGIWSHTVIIVHPDNPNDFKGNTSIKWGKTKSGEMEATFSANPNWKPNLKGAFGRLRANPSTINDRPERLKTIQRIYDPKKRSDTQLIKDIGNSASKYKDNLTYHPFPTSIDPTYNSNSYTSGVLQDAGISDIPKIGNFKPGANKPIPLNINRKER